jgi:tyrosine-protein kinase Etk/Wzc
MDEPEKKLTAPSDEIHLFDYLIILAKHSRLIIFASLAVMVLTYLILWLLPNKYKATARMLPPQQNLTMVAQVLESLGGSMSTTKPGGGLGGLGGMTGSLLGLKSPGDLYVGMLDGNSISDRIIERFQLRARYNQTYLEDVRKKLHQRAQISSGRDGLITINVTDESPQRAQAMANAYMDELDSLLQNMAVHEATNRLIYLEKKRNETVQALSKAEESLRNFSEGSSVLQIDTQTRGMLEYIATLRASIDSKEIQLKVLREQATPFNYDLIKLETEIKGLKEKLHEAKAQEVQNPKTGDPRIATSKMPALGLEYLRLFREAKFQEQLYQLYTKLVELARLDEVKGAAVVNVVDRALPPEKRSNQRLMPAAMAGLSAFLVMIFLVFVGEYWHAARQRQETADRLRLLNKHLTPLFFWKKHRHN